MKRKIFIFTFVVLLVSINAFAQCNLTGSSISGGLFFCNALTGSGTDDSPYLFANTGRKLFFGTNGDTTTPKMVIDTAGNVGIGTEAPAQKLSVAGTIESTTGGIKFPDGTIQLTASKGLKMQVFTSSGTFTAPAGVTSVVVEAWGGGGGGAACSFLGGPGGGGGAYAKASFDVTSGTAYTITVGAAGTAGNGNGGNGGNSSFGTLITAGGGFGATVPIFGLNDGYGIIGAGGTSTAAFNVPGFPGRQASAYDSSFVSTGGDGGSVAGYYGYGGVGGLSSVAASGGAGRLFGAGGGGGRYSESVAGSGGAGKKGQVIVWYIN